MNMKFSTRNICIAALLIALGIVIPMFSPVKIVMPPASFTLASHVAIFIAMMISPWIAVFVTIGTTLGFLLGGFPIVIVLRAASHIVFAVVGAYYIYKRPSILTSQLQVRVFSFILGAIHAVCEVVVVTMFYFGGQLGEGYYQNGFFQSVLLLVGLGTVIHSMVDFEISLIIFKVMQKQKFLISPTLKA